MAVELLFRNVQLEGRGVERTELPCLLCAVSPAKVVCANRRPLRVCELWLSTPDEEEDRYLEALATPRMPFYQPQHVQYL